ncbi:MAG: ABC transporter substrate-binding protein, partial [Methermicoccaceae archaeon]
MRWALVVVVLAAVLSVAVAGCVQTERASSPQVLNSSVICHVQDGTVHIANLSFATPNTRIDHPTTREYYEHLHSEMSSVSIGYPLRVVDDTGEVVVLTKKPERIVSLAPSNTEILFALGAGDRVVGVTDYCNYPPEATRKPKIGGYATPSIERIIGMEPDLVVSAYGVGKENIDALKSSGITVLSLNPTTLDDVLRDILLVGVACDEPENASRLVVSMVEQIDAVKQRTANATSTPRVMYTIWEGPYVAGSGTFADDMIAIAGGENIAAGR